LRIGPLVPVACMPASDLVICQVGIQNICYEVEASVGVPKIVTDGMSFVTRNNT